MHFLEMELGHLVDNAFEHVHPVKLDIVYGPVLFLILVEHFSSNDSDIFGNRILLSSSSQPFDCLPDSIPAGIQTVAELILRRKTRIYRYSSVFYV